MTQNVSVSVEGPGVRYKQENIGGKCIFFSGSMKLHHFGALAWIRSKTHVNTLNKMA